LLICQKWHIEKYIKIIIIMEEEAIHGDLDSAKKKRDREYSRLYYQRKKKEREKETEEEKSRRLEKSRTRVKEWRENNPKKNKEHRERSLYNSLTKRKERVICEMCGADLSTGYFQIHMKKQHFL
jgi:hypothetical protein